MVGVAAVGWKNRNEKRFVCMRLLGIMRGDEDND